MNIKTVFTASVLIFFAASAQGRDTDLATEDGPAILYTALKWGNVVDYGTSLIPVSAHKNLAACNAAKQTAVEPASPESRDKGGLVCHPAKTPDERALVQMLAIKARER